MIYVSHRLDEIFQISDRVAVLRDGAMIGMRDTNHTTPEELVHMIVGRKTRDISKNRHEKDKVLVEVSALRTAEAGPASFDLMQGEILGLVGLRGAGHEEIARALFGVEDFSGQVVLDGKTPDLTSPYLP